MPVQWLGWRPDVTPSYLQADIAKRGMDLREREANRPRGGGGVRRAVGKGAWEQEFKERQLAQAMKLAEMTEEGRGERSEAMQSRLTEQLDVQEKRKQVEEHREDIIRVFEETTDEGREQMKKNPLVAPIVKDLPTERYVKPKAMTEKQLENIREQAERDVPPVPYSFSPFFESTREKERREKVEEKISPYEDYFRGQWRDQGVGKSVLKKEEKEKKDSDMVEIKNKRTGETRFVTRKEAKAMKGKK